MTMARAASPAQFRSWQHGEAPEVDQVLDGIWSIPVRISHGRIRYVLVYAMAVDDGVVLVDAGWDDMVSWNDLEAGLQRIGRRVRDVRGVLVTHAHRDHAGLAGRLQEESGCWVAMTPTEAAVARAHHREPAALIDRNRGVLSDAGMDPDEVNVWAERWMSSLTDAAAPAVPVLVRPWDTIDLGEHRVRVIPTPGHSPGHVCYFEERTGVLFAGDHLLPNITPNVSVHAFQQADPLGDYLASLRRVARLPVGVVAPAHEYRFVGLTRRIDAVLEHHEHRLVEIRELLTCGGAASAASIASRLEWRRPWSTYPVQARRAGTAETLAHLVHLQSRGEVEPTIGQPRNWEPVVGSRLAETSIRMTSASRCDPGPTSADSAVVGTLHRSESA